MTSASRPTPDIRLDSHPIRDGIPATMRAFRTAVVGCAMALSLLFAAHRLGSPYRLPSGFELLVPCFLLLAVVIHLCLSRLRWFELREDGLAYRIAFSRERHVRWTDVCDVRYFLGGGLPLSLRVAGRRAPLTLGLPQPELTEWTDAALERMNLDTETGGPLLVWRRPRVYSVCAAVALVAALFSPLALLRALHAAPGAAYVLLCVAAPALLTLAFLRRPLHWGAEGISMHTGARTMRIPWAHVRVEWRRSVSGGTALFLHLAEAGTVRVPLSAWGAPRLVARLGEFEPAPAALATHPIVAIGPVFPLLLLVFTLLGGAFLQTSALMLGEIGWQRMQALGGEETLARVTGGTQQDAGVALRYEFRVNDRTYRGRGWLLPDAAGRVWTGSRIPVRYRADAPQYSLPRHDPRLFDAAYYAIFGIFLLLLVLPLVALLDVAPAPEPIRIPTLA